MYDRKVLHCQYISQWVWPHFGVYGGTVLLFHLEALAVHRTSSLMLSYGVINSVRAPSKYSVSGKNVRVSQRSTPSLRTLYITFNFSLIYYHYYHFDTYSKTAFYLTILIVFIFIMHSFIYEGLPIFCPAMWSSGRHRTLFINFYLHLCYIQHFLEKIIEILKRVFTSSDFFTSFTS